MWKLGEAWELEKGRGDETHGQLANLKAIEEPIL